MRAIRPEFRPPNFWVEPGDPAKQDAAVQLHSAFRLLVAAVDGFEADVALMAQGLALAAKIRATDFASLEASVPQEWALIAGRSGVMRIAGIAEYFSHIGRLANLIDANKFADRTLVKSARKRFKDAFPDYVEARNGVAHREEFHFQADVHGISEGTSLGDGAISIASGVHAYISDFLFGTTMNSTVRGKVVKCDVSLQSLEALDSAVRGFIAGYRHAGEAARLAAQAQNPPS